MIPEFLSAINVTSKRLSIYNTHFSEVIMYPLKILYRFVSNGNIMTNIKLFSCVHQTSIRMNDKLILAVEAHSVILISDKYKNE